MSSWIPRAERDPEPKPPVDGNGGFECIYNGRRFYGAGASDRAELTYLRDWQAWAKRQLQSLYAFERGVNEALNSGDGSYRP
jgi:hypothetical protein